MRATFCDDTIEFIEMGIEIKYVHGNPLCYINIFWQHYNRLEVSLYEGGIRKRTA